MAPGARLNVDIWALILDHIDDLPSLLSLSEAFVIWKKIAMRSIFLRRLFQTQIRLSCDYPQSTYPLVHSLIHRSFAHRTYMRYVRSLEVSLGSQADDSGQNEDGRSVTLDAMTLVKALPNIVVHMTDLRHFTWTFPDPATLGVLARLPRLDSFVLDCAIVLDRPDEHLADPKLYINAFFEALGPRIVNLEFRSVSDEEFTAICENLPRLPRLRSLKLDTEAGAGHSHFGDEDIYDFPRIGKRISNFEVRVSDAAVSPKKRGPLALVNSRYLQNLSVSVLYSSNTTMYDEIRLFQAVRGADFASLVHFELSDEVWDGNRWVRDGTRLGDTRAFYGIHEFLSQLPNLRHLLVNERILVVPSTNSPGNSYESPMQENMVRTVSSRQWSMMARTFWKLETLRVGFGIMDAYWVAQVLQLCNPRILRKFGFDWDWTLFGVDEPISSPLLQLLSRFPSLTDIHILRSRPKLPYHANYDRATVADAQRIFKACPNVCRVGIGRNIVWERATPCRRRPGGAIPVQMLGSVQIFGNRKPITGVPKFFDAGSSYLFIDTPEQDYSIINEENMTLLDILQRS